MKLPAVPLFPIVPAPAIAAIAALVLCTCERPDAPPPERSPSRARIGWLRTAKGTIPIEDVLDPNTTNARARAFCDTYGVESLTAEADLGGRLHGGLDARGDD
jgi:hypothetical protein